MTKSHRTDANQARRQLSTLLDAAERGQRTVITRNGRPLAALVPLGAADCRPLQRSLLPLSGTGRGLYGGDGATALREARDESSR